MIESKNETSKNLEKALQALEQAQQHVANEKKNRTRRNAKPRSTTSISWEGSKRSLLTFSPFGCRKADNALRRM